MKRIAALSLIVLMTAMTVSAQDKQEVRYTPEAGDMGVTISANPFFNYFGNLFNGSTDNTLGNVGGEPYNPGLSTLQPTVSFAGKYFITDNLAVRMNIGWMYSYDKNNFYVTDDAARLEDPNSDRQIIDSHITNTSGGSFMIGAEYRIGKGKVQGVFGGGLMYAFNSYNENFAYGNAITQENKRPSTSIENSTAPSGEETYRRYLSKFNEAPTHYFGLVGFAGVEWFVAPKISLGAEINLSAAFNWTKGLYYTSEGFNAETASVEEYTKLTTPTSSGFDFGTQNIGANLSVNFYF